MPIYKYKCKACEETSTFMHLSSETRTNCDKCNSKDTLVKILSKPVITKKNKLSTTDTVGEITKKFIEENREILDKQKKEYSNKSYDKS
tara:strand:+ start:231 stop:497 length:267 start_codon:yes stop_codon:yes gene_type:complete